MKQFKLSFLLFVLMSMINNKVSAYDFTASYQGKTIYYNIVNGTAQVTYKDNSYNSYSGAVIIPQTVTYNDKAYNVTSIGKYAFLECFGLTSITISNSVTSIGYDAFLRCSGLMSITVKEGNPVYDSRDNCNAIVNTNNNTLLWGCKNTTIPSSVTGIAGYAFTDCKSFLTIPSNVTSLGPYAFYHCKSLTSITIPSSVTYIGNSLFTGCTNLSSVIVDADNNNYDSRNNCNAIIKTSDNTLVAGCKNTIIPSGVTSIQGDAFRECGLTSITIPSSVTSISKYAFNGCSALTLVTMERSTPVSIDQECFYYRSKATLYVPRGCKAAYEAADYWKDFKEIVEYSPKATITMNSSGIATYSHNRDLDFTSVEGLKAYIGSGYSPSTGEMTMTRVYKVPAGEGLLLKGAAGDYEIPYTETDMYYSNLLVGVPTATTVNPTEGSYTNFILANGANGIGFYTLSAAGEIGPNKAYLQLPTSALPVASSRQVKLLFDDEEEVTGISDASCLNEKGKMINDKLFDLQGRRIAKPTRGLYIKDGKKVFVK